MKKILFTLITLFFLSSATYGEITSVLEGPFKIEPKAMHKKAITGVMSTLFEGEALSSIHLHLDEAVLGKTAFESKEQAMRAISSENLSQMIFIFKLEGPKHNWYFVAVTNWAKPEPPATDMAFSGSIYKVKAEMEEILDFVKDGVTEAPSDWKVVGSVALSALP